MEVSEKNKSIEKCDPKAATVAEHLHEFDELWNFNWIGIPGSPYVMKYKFDEDGYTLMVSDLAAVYGEKLDEKTVQERFQKLNPYVEMLPKVILKHVKQSVKNILASGQAHRKTGLQITLDTYLFSIHHEFNVSGVRFIFDFELEKLSDFQFRAHILSPILLKALFLDEEKAALERKLELLEGRYDSSSSGCSQRRNKKGIYSAIYKTNPPDSDVVEAFLLIQKDKIILPKSLEGIPNLSPTKEVHSSSTSSFLRNRVQDSENIIGSILYNEDDSDASLESQNTIPPEISIKIEDDTEETEDDENMNIFYNLIDNLSAKKDARKRVSPNREMSEEDSKEESASEPTPHLKPSPAKKKKLLKF